MDRGREPHARSRADAAPGAMARVAKIALVANGAVLAGAMWAAITGMVATSPAFNAESRAEGLFGDWRVSVAPALFDRSAYLFQLGHGFVNSDVVASAATEASDEIADLDVAFERAEQAIELLRESLSLAPGDAVTWDTLAWAQGLNGDVEAMMAAIDVSRQLAPHNVDLAFSRLSLVRLNAEFERDLESLGVPEDELNVARRNLARNLADLEVLRVHAPEYHRGTLDTFPELADLVAEIENRRPR